jgi:hypothetical protein
MERVSTQVGPTEPTRSQGFPADPISPTGPRAPSLAEGSKQQALQSPTLEILWESRQEHAGTTLPLGDVSPGKHMGLPSSWATYPPTKGPNQSQGQRLLL